MFERKAMDELKKWKENMAPRYAALLEGARRVGKSTIAEEFAKQEHKSISAFCDKYSEWIADRILLSQKDVGNKEMLHLYPVYMLPFILEE